MELSEESGEKYKKVNLILEDYCTIEVEIDKSIAEEIRKNNKINSENIDLKLSKVEDVYRYLIYYKKNKLLKKALKKDGTKFSESKYGDRSTGRDKNKYKSIVLLLESPHCDEFDLNNNPIAPAQGETGKLIDEKILSVLDEILRLDKNTILAEDEKLRVIIANPIQYQTSLYMYHNKKLEDEYQTLRNRCWRKIWDEKKIKDDFEKRIKQYNPVLIINACTYSLKDKVTKFLKDNKFENVYTSYHPSYWKGFNIKKEDWF